MADILLNICEEDIGIIQLILTNAANCWNDAGLSQTASRLGEYVAVIEVSPR